MARAPKPAPETSAPPLILAGAADERDEMPDEVALDRLLNELDADAQQAKVTLWRVNEEISGRGAGKDVYLLEMSPADFQEYGLAGVQVDYGAGKYRVKVNAENGQIMHNRIFNVGPIAKSRAVVAAPQTPMHNGSDSQQGLAALAQAMQNGFAQLAQIMLKQGENQAGNRKAMLEELMLYKSLFAPANAGASSEPVSAIMSAMTLLKEFGVGTGGGKETTATDVFLELAKEFGPAIAQIAQTQAVQRVRPTPPAVPVQQPNPQLTQAAPPIQPGPAPEEMTPMDTVAMGLRMYLPMFIVQAQAGNDPYKYADMILDNVSIDQAEALAQRPDWLEYLTSINAGVAANAQWFTQLRQHLLEIIAQERAEDSKTLTTPQGAAFNTLGEPDTE